MNDVWRKIYKWMTPEQWECFEMLCDLFYGAHHVFGIVRPSRKNGIVINSSNCSNHFGSFDYNNLTRAVVMAHDRMIRFSIEPSGPGMLKLSFHKRCSRDGDMAQCHPELEVAVDKIRKSFVQKESKGECGA